LQSGIAVLTAPKNISQQSVVHAGMTTRKWYHIAVYYNADKRIKLYF
jgi:hypothetical protein